MNKPVLILTRPAPASDAFWRVLPGDLRDRLTPVISPLMRIDPLGVSVDLTGVAGVIFSSANGVTFGPEPCDIPAYCIGTRTTTQAQSAGWSAVRVGQNADELVEGLQNQQPQTPLLHIAGQHQRGDIAERLSQAGLPTRTRAVYDQILLPLSAQAQAALSDDRPKIVPLFSPRTAQHFIASCPDLHNVIVIALSDAVAEMVEDSGANAVTIAAEPNAASMILQLETVLNWASLA